MSDVPRCAKYKLKVKVISADNLRGADFSGKSDPYVIIGLVGRKETEHKSEVIPKTLKPVWNFDSVIESFKSSDLLEMKVFDYDAIGSDDLLGRVEFAFDQLVNGVDEQDIELADEGKKAGKAPGTIRIKVQCEPHEYPQTDTRCFVTVVKAEGLRSVDWSLSGGKNSDPYCVVSLPGKRSSTWKTKTIFKDLNPVWDEEDEMRDYDPGDSIEFEVMDYDANDPHLLGQCSLVSTDFHPNGFEGELSLGEGRLTVRIDVQVPQYVEEIIDPGEHVGPHDREPAPFQLRSVDHGRTHRLAAYTRIGRSRRLLDESVDLVLDSPGICDVARLHAVIKCWRGPDPNIWMARIYDEKGSEGAGMGPGGGHMGGGTTVDGEKVDPVLGSGLEIGSVLRFGVREMWTFERAAMHLRSQDAEIACNRAAANSRQDPSMFRSLKIPSLAMDSALQRCPDWLSLVRVVLECILEPDEPPCVDCIETQDEIGRPVGKHEAFSLEAQETFPVQRILREVKIGGTIRLRLSSDPKLLAPILHHLEKQKKRMQEIYENRAQEALGD